MPRKKHHKSRVAARQASNRVETGARLGKRQAAEVASAAIKSALTPRKRGPNKAATPAGTRTSSRPVKSTVGELATTLGKRGPGRPAKGKTTKPFSGQSVQKNEIPKDTVKVLIPSSRSSGSRVRKRKFSEVEARDQVGELKTLPSGAQGNGIEKYARSQRLHFRKERLREACLTTNAQENDKVVSSHLHDPKKVAARIAKAMQTKRAKKEKRLFRGNRWTTRMSQDGDSREAMEAPQRKESLPQAEAGIRSPSRSSNDSTSSEIPIVDGKDPEDTPLSLLQRTQVQNEAQEIAQVGVDEATADTEDANSSAERIRAIQDSDQDGQQSALVEAHIEAAAAEAAVVAMPAEQNTSHPVTSTLDPTVQDHITALEASNAQKDDGQPSPWIAWHHNQPTSEHHPVPGPNDTEIAATLSRDASGSDTELDTNAQSPGAQLHTNERGMSNTGELRSDDTSSSSSQIDLAMAHEDPSKPVYEGDLVSNTSDDDANMISPIPQDGV